MEQLEQALQFVQLGVFLAAAVAAVGVWARHRTRPAVFLALTFGSLGFTLLVSRLASSTTLVPDAAWISDGVVVGLAAFPWLLALFAWSFERRFPGWLLVSGLAVVALGVWNLFVPDSVDGARSPSERVFVAAFLLVWIVLAGLAGAKLWRSGGTQPLVRARMRLMAAGAASLTLALVLAAAGPQETTVVSVGANLLAVVAASSFGAGFAPPRALRVWWRRITVADWQQMQGALISATTPQDAAAAVAPVVADLLGGGAAVVAADGEVLGYARLSPDEAEQAARRLVAGEPPAAGDEVVPVERAWLVIRPTAYTPIFGQDERDLVAGFASQLRLALDRAALFVANQEARRELERLRDDERAMVAGLVHDLRGASNTLGGYVGLLRSSETDDEREQILTGIEGGSQHLERLVGALLDVARLDAAERTMAPVDLAAVVAETIGRLAVSHPRVVVECAPLPTVEGVASELTQVFDNLLRNAAIHGGRDDLHVAITAVTHDAGTGPIDLASDGPGTEARGESATDRTNRPAPAGVVTIDVRDDGRGIDPEDREAVFRLFKRGRSAARGGSGVGLNIVRRIVEAHGGTVEVAENDPGAHFQICLPISNLQSQVNAAKADHAVANG